MVVAHDPGMSELAWRLSGGGIDHMPTCAAARFVFDVDSWAEALGRQADSHSFAAPKLLA